MYKSFLYGHTYLHSTRFKYGCSLPWPPTGGSSPEELPMASLRETATCMVHAAPSHMRANWLRKACPTCSQAGGCSPCAMDRAAMGRGCANASFRLKARASASICKFIYVHKKIWTIYIMSFAVLFQSQINVAVLHRTQMIFPSLQRKNEFSLLS